jgi:hypothetical protein
MEVGGPPALERKVILDADADRARARYRASIWPGISSCPTTPTTGCERGSARMTSRAAEVTAWSTG